jgi:rhodanese-related sulfurtransferase
MRKPFRFNRFLFLATIIFLSTGLQHISRGKNFSSCGPFCSTSLDNSLTGEVFAAGLETGEPTQTAAQASAEVEAPKVQMAHPEVPRIPAKELKDLLEKKADIVVVDTNPPDSYELWHIPGAINVPYASMEGTAKRDAMLARLPKDKLIVLYCLCEEGGDSSETALLLWRMDHRRDRVKVLEGGFIKWDEKGYPTFKKETPDGE